MKFNDDLCHRLIRIAHERPSVIQVTPDEFKWLWMEYGGVTIRGELPSTLYWQGIPVIIGDPEHPWRYYK